MPTGLAGAASPSAGCQALVRDTVNLAVAAATRALSTAGR
jgi:hypothetical protein